MLRERSSVALLKKKRRMEERNNLSSSEKKRHLAWIDGSHVFKDNEGEKGKIRHEYAHACV